MSDNILSQRRVGLEEAFFAKENKELLARLREKAQRESTLEALKQASGLEDEVLLQDLIDLGIRAATMAALGLVPLVQVAWADGKMDDEERAVLLEAASSSGVEAGSDSFALLESWLVERPGPEMMAAWSEYISALSASCSAGSRETLRAVTLGRARSVAEAAGGLLGIGSIARSEQRVLDQPPTFRTGPEPGIRGELSPELDLLRRRQVLNLVTHHLESCLAVEHQPRLVDRPAQTISKTLNRDPHAGCLGKSHRGTSSTLGIGTDLAPQYPGGE